jgi:hypothetical protein
MAAGAGMKLIVLICTPGILGLIASKFADCDLSWSWNEVDGVDLLVALFPWQLVSSYMAAAAGMKLIVLIYFGILGLTAGKFSHCGWNWMKLMILVFWYSQFDRM